MIRERVEIEIVDGKTTFKTVREELPLFARTGDLTETLGQYPATINPNMPKSKVPEPAPKVEGALYSADSIMF